MRARPSFQPGPGGWLGPFPTWCPQRPTRGCQDLPAGRSCSVPQRPTALPSAQTTGRGSERVRNLPKVAQPAEAELELEPGGRALSPHRRQGHIHDRNVPARPRHDAATPYVFPSRTSPNPTPTRPSGGTAGGAHGLAQPPRGILPTPQHPGAQRSLPLPAPEPRPSGTDLQALPTSDETGRDSEGKRHSLL